MTSKSSTTSSVVWVAIDVAKLTHQVSLIRFGGHLPKGGYDVQNGITQSRETSATTVHRGVHGRGRPVGLG